MGLVASWERWDEGSIPRPGQRVKDLASLLRSDPGQATPYAAAAKMDKKGMEGGRKCYQDPEVLLSGGWWNMLGPWGCGRRERETR